MWEEKSVHSTFECSWCGDMVKSIDPRVNTGGFKFFFFYIYLFLREREGTSGEGQREKETESEAGSRL